jgi:tetratricopeptide (TPR) repeat protein
MPSFIYYSLRSADQAKKPAGNLGMKLLRDADRVFWTCTAWRDDASMRAFINPVIEYRKLMLVIGYGRWEMADVWGSPMTSESSSELSSFDALWNYSDPASTEAKFRELTQVAREACNPAYLAELLTQIARAQGLQQKYAQAHATLDEVEHLIAADTQVAHVRSLLERGRLWNSSGSPEKSVPFFEQALDSARQEGFEFYAVDAAHMLGIVTTGHQSLKWHEEAIRMSEAAGDPRARKWLGALYNNTGWTYHEMGRHADALTMFEKHLQVRTAEHNEVQVGIALWSCGKMLRFLGRVDEALSMQRDGLTRPERQGDDSEGYTREEVGECLLLLGKSEEARPHFVRAWELLHNDAWLRQNEPDRLKRLRVLSFS